MRRALPPLLSAALLVLLVALFGLAGPAGAGWAGQLPHAAQTYPPVGIRVVAGEVAPTVVTSGGPVSFTGSGFAPHAPITLTLDGAQAGSVRADAAGRFTVTLALRGRGTEALAGSGPEVSGRLRIVTGQLTLLAARAPATAQTTGGGLLRLLLGFGLVVVFAAVSLAIRSRSHRRAAAARTRGPAAA